MSAAELRLRHAQGETRIAVGAGLLSEAAERLDGWLGGRRLFVVGSGRLFELYGALLGGLGALASAVEWVEVADGETAKTVEQLAAVWRRLLSRGGKRDSRLLTLGGGSTGDLGGFAAASFLRGVDYVQVPTTLLAMVDASIGGKTGIDLDAAKNSVGAFHHPYAVLADVDVLRTLPAADLRAGVVEMIKMAALLDAALFESLERQLDQLLVLDAGITTELIAGAMAAKVGVVERDEREAGERKLLNFGHTLGHAIETECGYEGIRHGEAVAFGISFALRLAERRGLDPALAERLRAFLRRLEPPTLPELAPGRLVEVMGRDKKAREKGLGWVVPTRLGAGEVISDVGWDEVRAELETFWRAPWSATG